MWKRTFGAAVSEVVRAPPERVWSLLSSPAAWSARPGGFSFGTHATSDAGRPLWVCLHADRPRVRLRLLEVTHDGGGHLIRLQTPDGLASWVLSVEPDRRGSQVRLAASAVIERSLKIAYQAEERGRLRSWARAMRAICAGQQPWPDGSMPEDVRQACLLDRTQGDGLRVTAQARVDRPPEAVARMIGTAQLAYAVVSGLLHYGELPGSPASGVGRMTYYISSNAGRTRLSASVVTDRQDDVVVVRSLEAPYNRFWYRTQPDGTAATLRLDFECYNRPRVQSAADHQAAHEQQIQRQALACKAAIEEAVPPSGSG